DIGMIGPEDALARRDILAEQLFRAGEIALVHQQQRQLVLRGRGFAVLLAEDLPPNRQRLTRGRLGFRAAPPIFQYARQLDQRNRDVLVHRTEYTPPDREALDEQRLRGRDIAERTLQDAQIVEALRHANVGAVRPAADRQRLFEQRQRLRVQPHPLVRAADDGEHLRL